MTSRALTVSQYRNRLRCSLDPLNVIYFTARVFTKSARFIYKRFPIRVTGLLSRLNLKYGAIMQTICDIYFPQNTIEEALSVDSEPRSVSRHRTRVASDW